MNLHKEIVDIVRDKQDHLLSLIQNGQISAKEIISILTYGVAPGKVCLSHFLYKQNIEYSFLKEHLSLTIDNTFYLVNSSTYNRWISLLDKGVVIHEIFFKEWESYLSNLYAASNPT